VISAPSLPTSRQRLKTISAFGCCFGFRMFLTFGSLMILLCIGRHIYDPVAGRCHARPSTTAVECRCCLRFRNRRIGSVDVAEDDLPPVLFCDGASRYGVPENLTTG